MVILPYNINLLLKTGVSAYVSYNYMNDVETIGRTNNYLRYSTICQKNIWTYFDKVYNPTLIPYKIYGIFRPFDIIAN